MISNADFFTNSIKICWLNKEIFRNENSQKIYLLSELSQELLADIDHPIQDPPGKKKWDPGRKERKQKESQDEAEERGGGVSGWWAVKLGKTVSQAREY